MRCLLYLVVWQDRVCEQCNCTVRVSLLCVVGAEVKSMAAPPIAVKMVMEAVCLLFGVEPKKVRPDMSRPGDFALDYWEPSKKVRRGCCVGVKQCFCVHLHPLCLGV